MNNSSQKKFGKRGMLFEQLLNKTNTYYRELDLCNVYKKPTPIRIISMSGNYITRAVFSEKSTTDYNGIYQGRYIDFEAKQTSTDFFDFSNIKQHQIKHLQHIQKLNGIAFILVFFKHKHTTFLIPIQSLPESSRMDYETMKSTYREIKTDLYIHYIDYLKEVYYD